MKIAIGSDHAGFHYKEKIKQFLKESGHDFHDFGTHSDKPVDYPLFIRPVAEAVAQGKYDRGIILGGSGNGEAIVANRIKGIRCTLCWDLESARFARKHNDANMLSIGERMVSPEEAIEIVDTWLKTPFDGGRHLRRINQIDQTGPLPGKLGPTSEVEENTESEKQAGRDNGDVKTSAAKPDILIAFRYIKYIEGNHSFQFQVDPGLKTPTVVHIPSAETWNSEVPEWAWDRRDEILDFVKEKSAHIKSEWHEY